jgi:hypothetical protein
VTLSLKHANPTAAAWLKCASCLKTRRSTVFWLAFWIQYDDAGSLTLLLWRGGPVKGGKTFLTWQISSLKITLPGPDHEQSSHDQRLLRHRPSSPIPQGQPVQGRRAHRGRCSHSRRGNKNLGWLWTTSSNNFTQNLSTSRSHSPSDRRNAASALGDRRDFRRGIKNALRSA